MKHLIILLLSVLTISAYGQDKYNHAYYNKLTELSGTDYVLATIESVGKMFTINSTSLLFLNTRTGQSKLIFLMVPISRRSSRSKWIVFKLIR